MFPPVSFILTHWVVSVDAAVKHQVQQLHQNGPSSDEFCWLQETNDDDVNVSFQILNIFLVYMRECADEKTDYFENEAFF